MRFRNNPEGERPQDLREDEDVEGHALMTQTERSDAHHSDQAPAEEAPADR